MLRKTYIDPRNRGLRASIALWCISLCLVCITVDKLDSGLVDLFQYLNVEKVVVT